MVLHGRFTCVPSVKNPTCRTSRAEPNVKNDPWRTHSNEGPRLSEALLEPPEVVVLRDLDGAKLLEVRRHPLRVEEDVAAAAEAIHQREKGHLRRIRLAVKHRFSEKCASKRHAV